VIDRQIAVFYNPARVLHEVEPAEPGWLGYLVAEVDGCVVGAAGGGMVGATTSQLAAPLGERPVAKRDFHVSSQLYVIYLDLAHLGQGIGTALLAGVTQQQVKCGATRQLVSVLADNPSGLRFYRARGFSEVSRSGYPPDDPQIEEIVMERALTPAPR
jgi:GNAT superfamily N-acetyltransferase